jgi:hypothetical protein
MLTVEVEQMHFQHRLQALRQGRPHADAGGARQRPWADALDTVTANTPASGRRLRLTWMLAVGNRWYGRSCCHAHAPGDHERTPEQLRGTLDVARRQCFAHGGTGNAQAAKVDGVHGFDAEAVLPPACCSGQSRRARALPKRKSSPMIRCRRQAAHQDAFDEILGRQRGSLRLKRRHGPDRRQPLQQGDLLAQAGQPRRCLVGSKKLARMRLEGKHGGRQGQRAVPAFNSWSSARWPRCTPSKLPMVSTVDVVARSGTPRKTCMGSGGNSGDYRRGLYQSSRASLDLASGGFLAK